MSAYLPSSVLGDDARYHRIRIRVRHTVFLPVTAVFAGLALLFALGLDLPSWAQYLPFAASLLVFGLPHGAVDHLVPARLYPRTSTASSVLGVCVLYLVVGGATLLLWLLVPVAGFTAFILVTWFHWGQGDLYSLRVLLGAQYLGRRTVQALCVVIRGALPMLVPLLGHPVPYRELMSSTTGVVDRAPSGVPVAALDPLFGGTSRGAIAVGLALLVITYVVITHAVLTVSATTDRRAWSYDVVEIVVLAAYFFFVPPVLAVGLYFCFWHSIRHIIRLELLKPASTRLLARGRAGPVLKSFIRDATPVTLCALALLAAFVVLLPSAPDDAPALLGAYLVAISVLTFPHVVIVCLMDRRQRVWSSESRSS